MNDDKSIKRFVQKIKRRRIAAVRRVRNCVRFISVKKAAGAGGLKRTES